MQSSIRHFHLSQRLQIVGALRGESKRAAGSERVSQMRCVRRGEKLGHGIPIWYTVTRHPKRVRRIAANAAAAQANRFWWRNQNQRINQDCRITPGCWLPRGHIGACEAA